MNDRSQFSDCSEKVFLRPFLRKKSDNLDVSKSIQKDARKLQRIMRLFLLIGRRRLAKKLAKRVVFR